MHESRMSKKIWQIPLHKCFVLCCVLFLLCLIQACQTTRTSNTKQSTNDSLHTQANPTELLRADPGYIQWLVQQSFLHEAKELSLMVSASSLLWRQNGYDVQTGPLLEKSSMWLDVYPKQLIGNIDNNEFSSGVSTVLATLSTPTIIASLQAKGLSLYLSDITESESVWMYNTSAQSQDIKRKKSTNTAISHKIATRLGSEKDIENLRNLLRQSIDIPQPMQVQKNLLLLGTDIVSSSTGLGPDFFLAARGHKDYIGAYAMVEIPPQAWDLLPTVHEDWQCVALTASQIDALAQKGLVPQSLERHKSFILNTKPDSPQTEKYSWAATGTIRGVDGNARRWIYAFADNPTQAILQWSDPSALAQRILNSSIIKNTGILAMPLVGLDLEDFYGLAPSIKNSINDILEGTSQNQQRLNPEPMLSAAKALAHQVRMYGGWSWLRHPLDMPTMQAFMRNPSQSASGPDFFASHMGELVKDAIHSQQTIELQNYFDDLIKHHIDSTRLAHTMPDLSTVSKLSHTSELLGMSHKDSEKLANAADALFISQFMAAQSGLLFFPAKSVMSLAACLHANDSTSSQSSVVQNHPLNKNIININDLQNSIVSMPSLAMLRQAANFATAKVMARLPSSSSSLMILSAVDDNNNQKKQYLMTASNFSNHDVVEKVHMHELFPYTTYSLYEIDTNYKYGGTRYIFPVNTDSSGKFSVKEDTKVKGDFELTLSPKSCRIFIVMVE